MIPLTGPQRRHLLSLAHHQESICFVGKSGVTDGLIAAINTAFDARELIKIKFNDFKTEKKALSAAIAERTESHLVSVIGHVAIFYREHPEEEKRKIVLS
jgi:RNA-binding protein